MDTITETNRLAQVVQQDGKDVLTLAQDALAVVASQNNTILSMQATVCTLQKELGISAAVIEADKVQTDSHVQAAAAAIQNIVSAIGAKVAVDEAVQTEEAAATVVPVAGVTVATPVTTRAAAPIVPAFPTAVKSDAPVD